MTQGYDNVGKGKFVFANGGNGNKLPLPYVFKMTRPELTKFLPGASRFWLVCAVLALYDKLMKE